MLTLNKGDHICYLGNALADRMQHHGFLETFIHAKFPDDELVFRNLAASGDEVATWHRSENFGSRDDWLTKTKADVIFAFYGFNESFQGKDGLDKFKKDIDQFIKDPLMRQFGMPARDELQKAGIDPAAYVQYDQGWYDGSIRATDRSSRSISARGRPPMASSSARMAPPG